MSFGTVLQNRDMASGEPNWPVPMKAIGAQNLLTMPGGVTVSGYLHKRGGKQLQLFKWPLRYVIIHKGCVYYFKSSTSASSQGAFSLNGYNRVMRAAEETTSHNVFPFKMVHISKKHRTWYFSAASEEERKKWMLALRKEIDRYHEKKETITDLSESGSGSDSGSFYDVVERTVNIKYVHNPADDSWQDEDDDDEEEDYIRPDAIDDGAPSYPPPPVPRPAKSDNPKPRHSVSGIEMSKPLPAVPTTKKAISELDLTRPRKESIAQNTDVKPPAIPSFPPAHKLPEFKPLPPPPISNTTDRDDKLPLRPKKPLHGFGISNDINQPSFQVVSPSSINDFSHSPNTDKKNSIPQNTLFANNQLKQQLCDILKNPPCPPVPLKPAVPVIDKPPIKSSHIAPPVPPTKPSYFSRSTDNHNPPDLPKNKPKLNQDKSPNLSSLTKPPAVIPRICPPKADTTKIGFSQIQRSPPDGQSFVDKAVESPVRPPRLKDVDEESDSDSDNDYEKVSLPPSVFVDTCDSLEVERLFKAMEITGSPLNGLFCIRNSAKAGKVVVVWDKQDAKLRNYRIYEKDTKVYLETEIQFLDVAALVEHYYKSPLPGHNTLVLKHAYGCTSNPR